MNRDAAARYGLQVQDVNQIVESAIGGNTIGMTVEGRKRYPISVRYARDFRTDLDSLKRINKDDGMGDYKAHLTPDMAGDWSADLSYQGPQPAKLKVPVNVKR